MTTPLAVAINAALLSPTGDYRAAGMHVYLSGLLDALAARDDVAVRAWAPGGAPREGVLERAGAIRWRAAPSSGRVGRIVWEQGRLAWEVARSGAQVFHGPAHAMPLACRLPAVVTVHDLSFVRVPEAFPAAQGWYLRAAMRASARLARRLIAVSGFTAAELVDVYGVPAARIQVVHNGRDPAFRPLPEPDVEAYRRHAGLPDRFVLAVGTLQPRKNLGLLLRAFGELRAGMAEPPGLVVAGAPGWGDSDLGRMASEMGLAGAVRFPGFVPQADLPLLYNAAAALALPSRYEGFGLPVLEAMACGRPAVVATGSSLTEVGGDAVLARGPDDAAGWAAALRQVLEDPALAAGMAARGLTRAAVFDRERAAAGTIQAYRAAAGLP